MAEETENAAVRAARAIGAASRNKDDQFVAKHWPKVDDQDPNKRELQRLGEAVASAVVAKIYSGYSKHLALGDWFEDAGYWLQAVTISFTGKSVVIAYYKKSDPSTIYTVTKHNINDFIALGYKKLEKQPF